MQRGADEIPRDMIHGSFKTFWRLTILSASQRSLPEEASGAHKQENREVMTLDLLKPTFPHPAKSRGLEKDNVG